jgi:hypothetical protein
MEVKRPNKLESIFWSIGLPGFGQILNGHLIKGIVFIALEIIINVQSNFNLAIQSSFLGETEAAVAIIDYQWVMFYPCIYMFAMWDAYRDASGYVPPFSFLPFAFGAYFVTVGLMLSPRTYLFGILFGPVWLPMLFLLPGIAVGFITQRLILIKINKTLVNS